MQNIAFSLAHKSPWQILTVHHYNHKEEVYQNIQHKVNYVQTFPNDRLSIRNLPGDGNATIAAGLRVNKFFNDSMYRALYIYRISH